MVHGSLLDPHGEFFILRAAPTPQQPGAGATSHELPADAAAHYEWHKGFAVGVEDSVWRCVVVCGLWQQWVREA